MMGGPMGPMPGQMGPPMGGKCDMGLLQQAIVSSRHSGFRGRGLPRGRGRGRGRGRYFRGARQGTRGDSNNQDVSTASHLSFTFHSCSSSLFLYYMQDENENENENEGQEGGQSAL